MLIGAGAVVDTKDNRGETALYEAVEFGKKDCAEVLLDAGAKICNLEDLNHPEWFLAMVKRRSSCKSSAYTLYGLLRKRWRECNVSVKVPLDMIRMLTGIVWDTRHDERWNVVVVESKKAK